MESGLSTTGAGRFHPVPVLIELAGGGQAFVRIAVTAAMTERTFTLPAEPT
jgi:hypothetical protein